MTTPDVVVVGLGPAGRALAHRLLVQGACVLAIDPRPDQSWAPTYGGWAAQLPAWLPGDVTGAQSTRTRLVAQGSHWIQGRYVVLDNRALQAHLSLDGAQVRRGVVADAELELLGPVVVDCRGGRGGTGRSDGAARRRRRRAAGRAAGPLQTAHGVKLPAEAGAQVLGEAEAVLMDWRPDDGLPRWGARRPSFCYVVPLPDGRVLAEETCLAGDPPLEEDELSVRLGRRLERHGIPSRVVRDAEVERVRIPMLPPPPVARNRFGVAGAELNPITGYSVFAALEHADAAARSLLGSGTIAPSRPPVRRLALQALLSLRPDAVVDLFEAFGRLPAASQRAVLDPAAPPGALLVALGRQWWRMSVPGRAALVSATARGVLS